MFKSKHEYSIEVNIPRQKIWDYYANGDELYTNYSKIDERFEYAKLEGELKPGATILLKIKNYSAFLKVVINSLEPPYRISYSGKAFLFHQEAENIFEEISSERTRITSKVCVRSPLAFLFGWYLNMRLQLTLLKSKDLLIEELSNSDCEQLKV